MAICLASSVYRTRTAWSRAALKAAVMADAKATESKEYLFRRGSLEGLTEMISHDLFDS
jgi:hypothetical protein